jgi:hypothetical protein
MQIIYDARIESGWKFAVGITVIALVPFMLGFLILGGLAWRDGFTLLAVVFLLMGVGAGYTATIICRGISIVTGYLICECSVRTFQLGMSNVSSAKYGVAPARNWGYMVVRARDSVFPILVICVGTLTLKNRLAEMTKEIETQALAWRGVQ